MVERAIRYKTHPSQITRTHAKTTEPARAPCQHLRRSTRSLAKSHTQHALLAEIPYATRAPCQNPKRSTRPLPKSQTQHALLARIRDTARSPCQAPRSSQRPLLKSQRQTTRPLPKSQKQQVPFQNPRCSTHSLTESEKQHAANTTPTRASCQHRSFNAWAETRRGHRRCSLNPCPQQHARTETLMNPKRGSTHHLLNQQGYTLNYIPFPLRAKSQL
jgi:hypothetical protein